MFFDELKSFICFGMGLMAGGLGAVIAVIISLGRYRQQQSQVESLHRRLDRLERLAKDFKPTPAEANDSPAAPVPTDVPPAGVTPAHGPAWPQPMRPTQLFVPIFGDYLL